MIERIHALCLQALRSRTGDQAADATNEPAGEVRVGTHRLGISIHFEGMQQQGANWIAPIEIQIHIDADEGDRFRIGVVGFGSTEEDAVRAAVDEWNVLVAAPLLSALGAETATRRREPTAIKIGNWQLYPGRAGLRGTVPSDLQQGGQFHRSLLTAIARASNDWPTENSETLRSVFIVASGADQQTEIQAAFDGFVNEQLTAEIEKLNWPDASEAYFYKQLFVAKLA